MRDFGQTFVVCRCNTSGCIRTSAETVVPCVTFLLQIQTLDKSPDFVCWSWIQALAMPQFRNFCLAFQGPGIDSSKAGLGMLRHAPTVLEACPPLGFDMLCRTEARYRANSEVRFCYRTVLSSKKAIWGAAKTELCVYTSSGMFRFFPSSAGWNPIAGKSLRADSVETDVTVSNKGFGPDPTWVGAAFGISLRDGLSATSVMTHCRVSNEELRSLCHSTFSQASPSHSTWTTLIAWFVLICCVMLSHSDPAEAGGFAFQIVYGVYSLEPV